MLEQNRRRGMVVMENFSVNSARSFVGKNVNLHLKDGAVIVNVQLRKIHKGLGKNHNLLEYFRPDNSQGTCILLKNVAWAEMLNLSLLKN